MSETYGNVAAVRYDFEDESFETCSPEAKLFIQELLIKEQDKRISASEALKHNWLQARLPKLIKLETSREQPK